ncbi:MAG: hypothetical protein HRU11_07420 [Parvularculaceae bacterium]|nr:hypothetical protein [Parvularculaceae bacterium]
MKNPFKSGKPSDEVFDEALKTLRVSLRSIARHQHHNPFARPMPCPVANMQHTGVVLRIF